MPAAGTGRLSQTVLRPFGNLLEAGNTFSPTKQLAEYEGLIITLVTAGKLGSAMFTINHLQHVFIDKEGKILWAAIFSAPLSSALKQDQEVFFRGRF